jgi:alpha-D-ribose 1-methylphosphonate 5-triphosphate synthase subunit PhnG
MCNQKGKVIGGTGRPYERGEADGVQAVERLLAVLDDEGGGRYEKWCQATLHLMCNQKGKVIGGTGRPYERGEADGVQAVERLLAVLDDEGGGIN